MKNFFICFFLCFFFFCAFGGLGIIKDGLKVIKKEGIRVIWHGENNKEIYYGEDIKEY